MASIVEKALSPISETVEAIDTPSEATNIIEPRNIEVGEAGTDQVRVEKLTNGELNQILTREWIATRVQAQTASTIPIYSLRVPHDIISSVDFLPRTPASVFEYFQADGIIFRIQAPIVPMSVGQLMMVWKPNATYNHTQHVLDVGAKGRSANTIENMIDINSERLSIGEGNAATLEVAFDSIVDFIRLPGKENDTQDFTWDQNAHNLYGVFELYVFNDINGGSDLDVQPLEVTIITQFKNPMVSVQRPYRALTRFGQEEGIVVSAAAIAGTAVAAGVATGITDTVADAIVGKDCTEFTVTGTGINSTNLVATNDHREVMILGYRPTDMEQNIYPQTPEEIDLRNWCSKKSRIDKVNWAIENNTGALLGQWDVTPIRRITLYGTPSGSVSTLSNVGFVANLFNFWRGDIIFGFEVVGNPFLRGALAVTWSPNGDTGNSFNERPMALLSIADGRFVEVRVPYNAIVPYLRSGDLTSSNFTDFEAMGRVKLAVHNPLHATTPVNIGSVNVNVYIRGENMQFMYLRKITNFTPCTPIPTGALQEVDAISLFNPPLRAMTYHQTFHHTDLSQILTQRRTIGAGRLLAGTWKITLPAPFLAADAISADGVVRVTGTPQALIQQAFAYRTGSDILSLTLNSQTTATVVVRAFGPGERGYHTASRDNTIEAATPGDITEVVRNGHSILTAMSFNKTQEYMVPLYTSIRKIPSQIVVQAEGTGSNAIPAYFPVAVVEVLITVDEPSDIVLNVSSGPGTQLKQFLGAPTFFIRPLFGRSEEQKNLPELRLVEKEDKISEKQMVEVSDLVAKFEKNGTNFETESKVLGQQEGRVNTTTHYSEDELINKTLALRTLNTTVREIDWKAPVGTPFNCSCGTTFFTLFGALAHKIPGHDITFDPSEDCIEALRESCLNDTADWKEFLESMGGIEHIVDTDIHRIMLKKVSFEVGKVLPKWDLGLERLDKHDLSKYSFEEILGYGPFFFRGFKGTAWEASLKHHIDNNDHHPKENRNMTKQDLKEALLDGIARGLQKKNIQVTLTSIAQEARESGPYLQRFNHQMQAAIALNEALTKVGYGQQEMFKLGYGDELDKISSVISDTSSDFKSTLHEARELCSDMKGVSQNANKVFAEASNIVDEARDSIQRISQTTGHVEETLSSASSAVTSALGEVKKFFSQFNQAVFGNPLKKFGFDRKDIIVLVQDLSAAATDSDLVAFGRGLYRVINNSLSTLQKATLGLVISLVFKYVFPSEVGMKMIRPFTLSNVAEVGMDFMGVQEAASDLDFVKAIVGIFLAGVCTIMGMKNPSEISRIAGGLFNIVNLSKTMSSFETIINCINKIIDWCKSKFSKDRQREKRILEQNKLFIKGFIEQVVELGQHSEASFFNDAKKRKRVIHLGNEALKFKQSLMVNGRDATPDFVNLVKLCDEAINMRRKCLVAPEGQVRQRPVPVTFLGSSQIGKTYLVSTILPKMLAKIKGDSVTVFEKPGGNNVYDTNYEGQTIYLINDALSAKNSDEAATYLHLTGNEPFAMNMADIPSKGIQMVSEFVVCTSNIEHPRVADTLNNPEAFMQRWYENCFYMKPKEEYLKRDGSLNKEVLRRTRIVNPDAYMNFYEIGWDGTNRLPLRNQELNWERKITFREILNRMATLEEAERMAAQRIGSDELDLSFMDNWDNDDDPINLKQETINAEVHGEQEGPGSHIGALQMMYSEHMQQARPLTENEMSWLQYQQKDGKVDAVRFLDYVFRWSCTEEVEPDQANHILHILIKNKLQPLLCTRFQNWSKLYSTMNWLYDPATEGIPPGNESQTIFGEFFGQSTNWWQQRFNKTRIWLETNEWLPKMTKKEFLKKSDEDADRFFYEGGASIEPGPGGFGYEEEWRAIKDYYSQLWFEDKLQFTGEMFKILLIISSPFIGAILGKNLGKAVNAARLAGAGLEPGFIPAWKNHDSYFDSYGRPLPYLHEKIKEKETPAVEEGYNDGRPGAGRKPVAKFTPVTPLGRQEGKNLQIAPLIMKNLVQLSRNDFRLQALGVKGHIILAPYHFFSALREGDRFSVHYRSGETEHTWSGPFKLERIRVAARPVNGQMTPIDWCIYDLGWVGKAFKDLTSHFISADNINRIEGLNGMRLSPDYMTTLSRCSLVMNKLMRSWDNTSIVQYPISIVSSGVRAPGACGSPWVVEGKQIGGEKIVGSHSWGETNIIGATPVSKEDLLEMISSLSQVIVKLQPTVPMVEQTDEDSDPVVSGQEEGSAACTVYDVHGRVTRENAHFVPAKSELSRTPWHSRIVESAHSPAALSNRDKRLKDKENFENNLIGKTDKTTGWFEDSRPFNLAEKALSDDINNLPLGCFEAKKLSVFEAINGNLESDYGKSLGWEMRNSPGYPWNKTKGKGKYPHCVETVLPDGTRTFMPNEELLERFNERIELAKQGKVIANSIWLDVKKDELRPNEKVADGKTRIVNAPPLDLMLAWSVYFGAFKAFFMNPDNVGLPLESAMGIDPNMSWQSLAMELKQSHGFFSVDYKSYDSTIPAEMHHAMCRIINRWYTFHGEDEKETEQDNKIREVLLYEMPHTTHLFGDYLYEDHHGNPSGAPAGLTTISNIIVNMLISRTAWTQTTGKHPSLFKMHVGCIFMGDDNLQWIRNPSTEDCQDKEYSRLSLRECVEPLGMTVTSADKSLVLTPYDSWNEVSFLKRTFDDSAITGIFLPRIEESTINNLINWVRDQNNPDQPYDNLIEALKFKAPQGESEYRKLVDKLLANDQVKSFLRGRTLPTWGQSLYGTYTVTGMEIYKEEPVVTSNRARSMTLGGVVNQRLGHDSSPASTGI